MGTLYDGTEIGEKYLSNQSILEQAIDLIDKLIKNEINSVTFVGPPACGAVLHAANIHTMGGYKPCINQIDYMGRKGSGIYLEYNQIDWFIDEWFSMVEKYSKWESFMEKCYFSIT